MKFEMLKWMFYRFCLYLKQKLTASYEAIQRNVLGLFRSKGDSSGPTLPTCDCKRSRSSCCFNWCLLICLNTHVFNIENKRCKETPRTSASPFKL